MSRFVIRGGKPLKGQHRVPGNKNAALPMLAACVLTDRPVTLRNVPLIDDVRAMLEILSGLGVDVSLRGHTVTLCAKAVRTTKPDRTLCGSLRGSILLSGPLAARFGSAAIFSPGGDAIGRRPLDTHLDALRQMGIRVSGRAPYRFRRGRLRGTDILLGEASVTASENIIMAATLARGVTTIFNCACEPHVQDLCRLLNKMGARIEGIGTNRLRIEGRRELGGASHRLGGDYVDAASLIAAAAVTGGEIAIEDAPLEDLTVVKTPFSRLGVKWQASGGRLRVARHRSIGIRDDFGGAIPRIEDGVWPTFPSDLMSVAIVTATQARGTALFFEKMFESRMYFVDRLIEMGARIVQCDPHRVIVTGPAVLRGTHLSSPDIRAGMALIIAALCAKGESVIDNAQVIDRGYEQIDSELRAIGADIERA